MITSDVKFCKYNPETKKYDVTYQNGTYPYNYLSIEWVKDPDTLNPALVRVYHGERKLFNIQEVYVFHAKAGDYWHIRFTDGSERTYDKRELKITYSCLSDQDAQNCMSYLKQLAAMNELRGDDGEKLLQNQYDGLDFPANDTVMAIYLNPAKYKVHTYPKHNLIFPFGGNASQFEAVENALDHQISVIQGPPGTGKTQTILNIIANLLIDGKTVQIVSNNNSATENVRDKLTSPEYNMGFLVAALGNSGNKEAFIQTQTGRYPDLSGWKMAGGRQAELQQKIKSHTEKLSDTFDKQKRLAQIRQEFDSLLLEKKYFSLWNFKLEVLQEKLAGSYYDAAKPFL